MHGKDTYINEYYWSFLHPSQLLHSLSSVLHESIISHFILFATSQFSKKSKPSDNSIKTTHNTQPFFFI